MNVPYNLLGDLPDQTTYGGGPFREVRLFVDGRLAGTVFPYVVVFTGGIAPTLCRFVLHLCHDDLSHLLTTILQANRCLRRIGPAYFLHRLDAVRAYPHGWEITQHHHGRRLR